ncbi:MAG: hypothetical protein Q8O50_05520, partial [Hydrogenophaga sp.]|nr:hypothetical protein [Hydrogenophaga sp.]
RIREAVEYMVNIRMSAGAHGVSQSSDQRVSRCLLAVSNQFGAIGTICAGTEAKTLAPIGTPGATFQPQTNEKSVSTGYK